MRRVKPSATGRRTSRTRTTSSARPSDRIRTRPLCATSRRSSARRSASRPSRRSAACRTISWPASAAAAMPSARSTTSATTRRSRSSASRRADAVRPRQTMPRRSRVPASRASCTVPSAICCRTRMARSSRRIPSRPDSTTRVSDRNIPIIKMKGSSSTSR